MKTLLGKELGEPVVHESCSGCKKCVDICPSEVLKMENSKAKVVSEGSFFGCIACGHCMAICPSESIVVSRRGISAEDKMEYPSNIATSEQLHALLLSRRSIRRFKEEEIEQELIDKIIDMASTHPMGIPPTQVELTIFKGREKVQAFAKDMVASFKPAAKFIKTIRFLFYPFLGKTVRDMFRDFVIPLLEKTHERREKGEDVLLWDAPLAILFHHGPNADPSDCDIAVTYAMLAAHSLGLGSCMIGTVKEMLGRNKSLKQKYGIPKENKTGLMLIIGHPDIKFQNVIKRKFAKVSYI